MQEGMLAQQLALASLVLEAAPQSFPVWDESPPSLDTSSYGYYPL
jgi:hypothetical protein